jgi:hypothetical protein
LFLCRDKLQAHPTMRKFTGIPVVGTFPDHARCQALSEVAVAALWIDLG